MPMPLGTKTTISPAPLTNLGGITSGALPPPTGMGGNFLGPPTSVPPTSPPAAGFLGPPTLLHPGGGGGLTALTLAAGDDRRRRKT